MKPHRHPSGFTLFELLVSVTLIVTVVGIVYGSVMTASKASQRTTHRLQQSQRSALALDQIAGLWRCLYQPQAQDLPVKFRTALHDGDLLRFVSLSPWLDTEICQPIWNRVTFNQGDLVLYQSLLSPNLQDVLAEDDPQVLLENVTHVAVRAQQKGQWTTWPTNQPAVLRVTLVTGKTYELVMTAGRSPMEVSP